MRLRSVRRRDVWPYVGCVHCATQDDGEFHVYSGNLPCEKLFPVIFAVDGNHAGMVLRMSCARRDTSHNRIEVAGNLTNDGRRCGSRENFQSLMGSRERWVTKTFSR